MSEYTDETFDFVIVGSGGGSFCAALLMKSQGKSPIILEKLLTRHGFADIEIKPGLNAFALMMWTWLSRSGIPHAENLAIPLALVMLAPIAGIIFFLSWLKIKFGSGDGHIMKWLTQRALLDFAGHLSFAARKRSPMVTVRRSVGG